MSRKNGITVAGVAVAMSLALNVSVAHAASNASPGDALAGSVTAALHGTGRGIRVQVVDGTVYLYGTVDTYAQRASIEETATAAAQGHKVVDSIEFSPS